MRYYPETVESLLERLKRLPGIGPKSAERIVNYMLGEDDNKIISLAENLISLKKNTRLCDRCFNLTDKPLCDVCQQDNREDILCIVEEVKDLVLIEKTGYRGRYHVLGGRISSLDRVSPSDIRIPQLMERLQKEKFAEIIIATNPTPEGEDTASYISKLLNENNLSHSRIACGMPVGSEIEYVDTQTLKKSIEGRRRIEK